MRRNKHFLLIGLPLVVVSPLLVISYLLGPVSLWLWAGIGLGMGYISWGYKKRQKQTDQ